MNNEAHQKLYECLKKLSLPVQLGHVESEIIRARNMRTRGDHAQYQNALFRAIDLIDIIIACNKPSHRLTELLRLREGIGCVASESSEYDITLESIEKYLNQFSLCGAAV